MSLTYGFYNSTNYDRMYDARDMSRIFDGIISDGVYSNVGHCFGITPYGAMTIKVASGRAWFNNTWTYNDSDMTVIIPASDQTFDRIDAVVIEVDTTENARKNSIKVVSGTPAANPTNPDLIKTNGVYQYPLAYIFVRVASTSITDSDITITVGTSECPFVTAALQTTSIDGLWEIWSREFQRWFASLQYILDGDVAGHLQYQIEGKANNDAWVNVVLSASSWVGNEYSFESLYPNAYYDVLDVLPCESTTDEQRDAYLNADLTGYYTTNKIIAHATIPTVDIPVTIRVRYKSPGSYVPTQNE